jgi:LDH2 family malate/lactate/ureidoglycolate dehydrogenase
MRRFDQERAFELAFSACRGAGASEAAARSLAEATVAAELRGKPSVGFQHLLDYLAAFAAGRIVGGAEPELSSPAAAIIRSDARGGSRNSDSTARSKIYVSVAPLTASRSSRRTIASLRANSATTSAASRRPAS